MSGTGRIRSKRRASGFVLVTMVVAIPLLLACVGLAVDTGYLHLVKSRMQTAADAAALGGVQENAQSGSANLVAAAKGDAALNGFTDAQNGVTITVNRPPTSGFYTADASAVEVLISQNVKILFMSVLGFTSVTVTSRSVAHQGPGTNCLYTLEPSASSAFSISGGATLAVGCGIMVNSSSATALTATGGARVTATAINVVGGYSSGGGASLSPTPVTHVANNGDPLAYVTPPAVGACWQNNWTASNGVTKAITQGVYCGGITMNGGSTVTMSPGTYILLGGGLHVSNGARLTGTGVTFYITGGTGHPYGPVTLIGGTTLHLSAPTSGPLAGILFFQDRSIASPAASAFAGGTTITFDGALYFPTSLLSYTGGASSHYTILVSKTVIFSGGITMNADYSSLVSGSPVKGTAALSE
ncbi:MAG: pilus assembly protein TadG-related protein [Candidatus Solibacter sp.]